MAKKGQKSSRNVPELYNEIKKCRSFCLTDTALTNLDIWAKRLNTSRSELVEQFCRGKFFVDETPPF